MNRIDGSAHYEVQTAGQTPSLLTLIIDTNPRAWAALSNTLPFSKAIANILVFVNAHLAFGNDNQVAIIAAHTGRAVWLYPKPPSVDPAEHEDVDMVDADGAGERNAIHNKMKVKIKLKGSSDSTNATNSANKYPQFAAIEASLLSSLQDLVDTTVPSDLGPTPALSGALSLALSHINKTSISYAPPSTSMDPANPVPPSAIESAPALHARIMVVSVSSSEPAQYIPTMNAIFAAAHARIPIDTLHLSIPVPPGAAESGKGPTSPTFLQQGAFITSGTYLAAAQPLGLLTYLLLNFLPDAEARQHLLTATQDSVDFRAACFCHRNVIDTGFVCSICLSIFCEPPPEGECLTCGTKLALGKYGGKPAVVPKQKKKKKRRLNGDGREDSGTGTPAP